MRAAFLVLIWLLVPSFAQAQTCPAVLNHATRLALVVAMGMNTSAARLTLYDRRSRHVPWRRRAAATPVRLGERGMAWGAGFQHFARWGERVKHERDWRTPAGIYRIGAPFGYGLPGAAAMSS